MSWNCGGSVAGQPIYYEQTNFLRGWDTWWTDKAFFVMGNSSRNNLRTVCMYGMHVLDTFLLTMTTNNVSETRYSSEKQLLLCYTLVFCISTLFLNIKLA